MKDLIEKMLKSSSITDGEGLITLIKFYAWSKIAVGM